MPTLRAFLLSTLLTLFPAATPAQTALAPNVGAIPAARTESWWVARHEDILKQVQQSPDTQLLLIGDSITNNYVKSKLPDENFQPTWQQFYAPRHALNLGFSGDTTQNVLWRLDHGEIDNLHPKAAILLIGTNNTGVGHQDAEQTEVGIDAVIADLEARLPQTRILLLAILPSGISPQKTQQDDLVNQYLARNYGENPRVTCIDIGSIFFKDGVLDSVIFYDPRLPNHPGPLHPDTLGQRRMAEAIEPTLARLMGDTPQVPLASMTDINIALIPTERLEQDSYDWYARHHAELYLQTTLNPRVVLFGDSITHFWAGPPNANHVNGPTAWQHVFGSMPVLNMGFGWDRTQNLLWRLQHGEFDNLHPQWIVLNIGTNNLTATDHARSSTPEEIVTSIATICRELHTRSPQSRILLMSIFPRGPRPDSPLRAPILKTNQLLAQHFAGNPSVTIIDLYSKFLAPDGALSPAIMPDGTHPSDTGYGIWADALIQAGITP